MLEQISETNESLQRRSNEGRVHQFINWLLDAGLFMALQERIIVCGAGLTALGMALRFVAGPAATAAGAVALGLRGDLLRLAIIQVIFCSVLVLNDTTKIDRFFHCFLTSPGDRSTDRLRSPSPSPRSCSPRSTACTPMCSAPRKYIL